MLNSVSRIFRKVRSVVSSSRPGFRAFGWILGSTMVQTQDRPRGVRDVFRRSAGRAREEKRSGAIPSVFGLSVESVPQWKAYVSDLSLSPFCSRSFVFGREWSCILGMSHMRARAVCGFRMCMFSSRGCSQSHVNRVSLSWFCVGRHVLFFLFWKVWQTNSSV